MDIVDKIKIKNSLENQKQKTAIGKTRIIKKSVCLAEEMQKIIDFFETTQGNEFRNNLLQDKKDPDESLYFSAMAFYDLIQLLHAEGKIDIYEKKTFSFKIELKGTTYDLNKRRAITSQPAEDFEISIRETV